VFSTYELELVKRQIWLRTEKCLKAVMTMKLQDASGLGLSIILSAGQSQVEASLDLSPATTPASSNQKSREVGIQAESFWNLETVG
jgi:hypothetical protein